jgi:hypothetical protein
MNVVGIRRALVDRLGSHGFEVRGVAKFEKIGHPMRFKIGTTGTEVTLSVWEKIGQVAILRVSAEDQVKSALKFIDIYTEGIA